MNAPAPGWNPDPTGRHEYRYWDGATWTDDVSDSGVTAVDPIADAGAGAAPGSEATAPFEPTSPYEPTQAYGSPSGPPPGTPQGPDPYGGPPGPGGPGGPGGYGGYSSGQFPPAKPASSGPPVGLIVGIAVVALVVIVGLVLALSGGDDDTATDDTTTTETSDDTTDTSDDTTDTTAAENADVFSLAVGDCLASETAGEVVEEVPIISCDEPHLSEVYYSHIIEAEQLPDATEMETIVQDVCLTEFQNFVGLDYYDSALEVTWLEPTAESWEAGDRELLCLVQDPSGDVTGTLAGANY